MTDPISTVNPQTPIADWWGTQERLDTEQAAELIGVDVRTLSNYMSRGLFTVPRYKYGKRNFYRRSEILNELANHVEVIGIG